MTTFEFKGNIGICKKCGSEDDLHPCGPSKEEICFDCAMKASGATFQRLYNLLNGGRS